MRLSLPPLENEVIPVLRKQKGFKDEITLVAPERNQAVAVSSGIGKSTRRFTRTHFYEDEEDKIRYWQRIFLQSKANGCSYRGDDLPHMKWQWPRDTWFQEQRSHHLRDLELAD